MLYWKTSTFSSSMPSLPARSTPTSCLHCKPGSIEAVFSLKLEGRNGNARLVLSPIVWFLSLFMAPVSCHQLSPSCPPMIHSDKTRIYFLCQQLSQNQLRSASLPFANRGHS